MSKAVIMEGFKNFPETVDKAIKDIINVIDPLGVEELQKQDLIFYADSAKKNFVAFFKQMGN